MSSCVAQYNPQASMLSKCHQHGLIDTVAEMQAPAVTVTLASVAMETHR